MPQVGVTISVDIGDALQRIYAGSPKIDIGIGRAIRKSALLVEREAKIRTPVDTGQLQGSIAADIYPLMATIEPHKDYAMYVHEGTRFMSARPFMVQGADAARSTIQTIFDDEIANIMKNI